MMTFRSGGLFGQPLFGLRCLATANITQVQNTLIFTESQNVNPFRIGLTPTAPQSHPQTAMPYYRHRVYHRE